VQPVAAITVDEVCAVVGDAPAFAGNTKPLNTLEVGLIIDKGNLASPGELVDFVAHYRQALAKESGVQLLTHFQRAICHRISQQSGPLVLAGADKQFVIYDLQTLNKVFPWLGHAPRHLIAVHGLCV